MKWKKLLNGFRLFEHSCQQICTNIMGIGLNHSNMSIDVIVMITRRFSSIIIGVLKVVQVEKSLTELVLIDLSSILSYITSSRLVMGLRGKGLLVMFIIHWQNQVHLYE